MTEIKLYKKYRSFKTFSSSINADLGLQTQRILRIIKEQMNSVSDLYQKKILEMVVSDLSHVGKREGQFTLSQSIADEISKIEDEHIGRYMFHRYRYDIFPQQKKLDEFPPYLQIEPTSVCNYRCVFCYQTDSEFTARANGYMGAMDLDLFKEVIDQAVGKVEFLSLASRGEPLLCKDIDTMLEYCIGKFLGLKLNTNASMLTEQRCHAILSGGVNTIVFSADAAKEPLYSQLRVKGSLDKVLNNVKLLQSIKKKHYPNSKIITRVSGVMFGEDQDMDSMVSLWGDFVDQVVFVAYNPWENVYESPVNTVAAPCSDLWRRMFVWYDGRVNPCDTDYKSMLSVGNIKGKSLAQLWRAEAYEALRRQHLQKNRSCVNPCQRCVVV